MKQETAKPLISVIVPVHNGQDYIKACVDSICAQTYPETEIILVDDGSEDQTNAICRELCKEKENISLITMEDLGVSAARNRAIRQAKGNYITFVDADDRIRPEMLDVLYRALTETDSDFAGCDFFTWHDSDSYQAALAKDGAEGERSFFSPEEFVTAGILKNNTRCWSKLYRKECFEKTGFREGLTIGEDMMLLVDMIPHIRRAVSVEFKGYGYYRNMQGAMNRKFRPSYMDQIRCWELAGETLQNWAVQSKALSTGEKENIAEICGARLMVGIMLAAGKLAELTPGQRRQNREYIRVCHEKIRDCVRRGTGYALLDRGYQIKVRTFSLLPGLYLTAYGILAGIKNKR